MQNDLAKKQYADSRNLSTRINLHAKYSMNKQGFGNWIYNQYRFAPGMSILELGCGNGSVWPEKIAELPKGCRLTLSDFSAGMLEDCKARVGQHESLKYCQADIMDIPADDASQDVVIANMMLYHVPDIHRGLAEVRRVLKPGGLFYCATYGENGLMKWLNDVFDAYKLDIRMNTEFTLQNGEAMLRKHFGRVKQLRYEDAFEITDTDDLVNYVLSMTSMAKLERVPREEIFALLDAKKENGVIHIPKEYGMFIVE